MPTKLTHKLVFETIQRGIEIGQKRNFPVACGIVDASGRTLGVIRHEDALWMAPEFALGKARLASAYRHRTGPFFERLQKERPLYGATVASLNAEYDWFLAEGGTAVMVPDENGKDACVAGVGIAGCFPASVDQECADEVVTWLKEQLGKKK